MKKIIVLLASIVCYTQLSAQTTDNKTEEKDKEKITISIGSPHGINVSKGNKNMLGKKKKSNDKISSSLVFDLGFNNFQNTGLPNSFPFAIQTNNTLAIEGNPGKVNSLDLNTSKSMNVNLYPFMYSIHLYKKSINLTTGLGFNWYNFRYNNDVLISKNVDSLNTSNVGVIYNHHNANIKKNKIAASYLTLPLSLQFKPKMGKNRLVFGAGASVGYLLKGWNKTKYTDGARGRTTISPVFNTWQVNAIGEIGIDDKIRLYGSYALTDLYKTPLGQKQFAFGIRFFGL